MSYFFGLLVRRERWTLSLRGTLLASFLIVVLAFTAFWRAYPFLAVNHPIHGDVLVLEGWVPIYTLNQVADAFRNGHYRKLLIIRTFDVDERKSREMQATLVNCGLAATSVETVYHPAVRKDRTYHAALAAKNWLGDHERPLGSIDVVTVGSHARRSRLLFQKAFGKTAAVGIIPLDDAAYDSQHWWRTSEGVREVVGETIAYVYARFFFAWN
ncbi:MAG: hypothetical protein DMG13_20170 [Acidobacteria bacterium]|nr:MAG: hypothetical protein DMG13_20170 [Acidobacteriota bacterium]